jgi:hypothetical protein
VPAGRHAATTLRPCGQHGEGATPAWGGRHSRRKGRLAAGKSIGVGCGAYVGAGRSGDSTIRECAAACEPQVGHGNVKSDRWGPLVILRILPSVCGAAFQKGWRAWTVGMSRGSLRGSRPVAGGNRGLGPRDRSGEGSGQSEWLRRVEARPVHWEGFCGKCSP